MANSANFPSTPDLADKNENSPAIRPTINSRSIRARSISLGRRRMTLRAFLEAFPYPGDTASPRSIIKVDVRSGKYRTLGDDGDQGQLLYDRQAVSGFSTRWRDAPTNGSSWSCTRAC